MGGVLLSLTTGTQMLHVPYKGAILGLADVIRGHVDSMFVAASAALPQVKSGKIRALAVASPRRTASLPDLPTFAEAGYSGVEVESRYGILGPGALPRELVARLNAAIGRALTSPDVRERYAQQGLEATPGGATEYQTWLREDIAKWRRVVASAKIRAD